MERRILRFLLPGVQILYSSHPLHVMETCKYGFHSHDYMLCGEGDLQM